LLIPSEIIGWGKAPSARVAAQVPDRIDHHHLVHGPVEKEGRRIASSPRTDHYDIDVMLVHRRSSLFCSRWTGVVAWW